jgi:hypothetical protein
MMSGRLNTSYLAAIFLAPIIVQGWIALLNVGAHRAVVDDYALFYGL